MSLGEMQICSYLTTTFTCNELSSGCLAASYLLQDLLLTPEILRRTSSQRRCAVFNLLLAISQGLKQRKAKKTRDIVAITTTRAGSKKLLENTLMLNEVVFFGFLSHHSSITGEDGIGLQKSLMKCNQVLEPFPIVEEPD